MTEPTSNDTTVDNAVAQGGAYEVLRRRLAEQGNRLHGLADVLNTQRLTEFGDSTMAITGRLRIRSDHNAVGRDIVQVGDLLLFGYNVFLGLKSTTAISDVFSLYRLVETADGYDVTPVDPAGTFIDDGAFKRDFSELYAYYKEARLLQLVLKDSKLLAAFQIGQKTTDVRVFRWNLASTGELSYIDMRGERDIVLPPPFDFEWTRATKDMEISGRFPHLNIFDTLFVETTGGDLTIKVENNTESGSGVYSEPVDDRTQSLDDARIEFARVGSLILLKVLPYRESHWRGLVYNTLTNKVTRLDAIVQACIQLPEDHGIIFPGGYYLQNGEHKAFDATVAGMQYKRTIRSPNGEDVLYVYHRARDGAYALYPYNLISKAVATPIHCHG
ncbi:MAG: DNA repair ATPase, partial [Pseudomonadota bacterium]|nr:DNA repair ATPase [Pseudomonadota bacterium]